MGHFSTKSLTAEDMKSRRTERKLKRKEKKEKRNSFYLNRNKKYVKPEANDHILSSRPAIEAKTTTEDNQPKANRKVKDSKIKRITNQPKVSFRQKKEIEREDKEIKRLEKLLKLNRRKKNGKRVTTLPKSFQVDGLAYVLDGIDNRNRNQPIDDNEQPDPDSDVDMQRDISDETTQTNHSDEFDHLDESSSVDLQSAAESDSDEIMDSDGSSEQEEEEAFHLGTRDKRIKEDIYGVKINCGDVAKEGVDTNKLSVTVDESGFNEQILRRIRGSLNRLTVNNILGISGQIQELYEQNSRNAVNQALFKCITTSIIDFDYVTPPKMKTELAILVAILHHGVGEEVGAHMIHSCVCKFDQLVKQLQTNDSKTVDNLLLFMTNLYVCGVTEAQLIYGLTDILCDNFTEKSIELIILILKSVGFVLRKDNATKMKELILRIQSEAKRVDKNSLSGCRIGFLLDSLMAIKNNNVTKLKGYGSEIDLQLIETTLKSAVKRPRVNSIAGTYEAILQSSHWYSFTQNIEATSLNRKTAKDWTSDSGPENRVNEKLIKVLRLNTPLRKAIVLSLSTCDDYIDASSRLMTIGRKRFSEVINVLLHVCIREKQFNPFYSHLFNHLSKCDRKYRVSEYVMAFVDLICSSPSVSPRFRNPRQNN